jgi:hypothetical protein
MDATPVPCGTSAVTAKRSDLFGHAGYGYCPSHSRWYRGAKLLIICTCDGTVTGFSLANPKLHGERDQAHAWPANVANGGRSASPSAVAVNTTPVTRRCRARPCSRLSFTEPSRRAAGTGSPFTSGTAASFAHGHRANSGLDGL